MNAIKAIILWLTLALACFVPASALAPAAPENRIWEIFSIGYDAPSAEATDLESHTETSTSNYDTTPIHSAITHEIPTEANRSLFGQSAEFKAAESGPALARSLGQAGEDAVGITGPKTAIEIRESGQIRIPDALTDTTLTEVKNVNSLSYTQQLRDFSTYSQQNGLNFELYVRPSTQLSGPLQQAVTNGQITLKFIPRAQ